jgi:short-subunit dehydrogenase
MDFAQTYGKMAVIAGGSEGVGLAYARHLLERGIDVMLVARNPDTLAKETAVLSRDFPKREVLSLAADLSDAATPKRLFDQTAGREVGMLIYNAGASSKAGNFLDLDINYALNLHALNTTTKMVLTHHYGRLMKQRGRGGIILVGSFAGFVGIPEQAVYSAVKAFSATLAEALWFELKPHGVHVLGHVLGSVATPAMARHYPSMAGFGADPMKVAEAGLAAIADGPILRAEGGDAFASMFSPIKRREAVEAAYAAGADYRKD